MLPESSGFLKTYRLACLIMLQSRGPELPCSNVYVAYLHSCVDSWVEFGGLGICSEVTDFNLTVYLELGQGLVPPQGHLVDSGAAFDAHIQDGDFCVPHSCHPWNLHL